MSPGGGDHKLGRQSGVGVWRNELFISHQINQKLVEDLIKLRVNKVLR